MRYLKSLTIAIFLLRGLYFTEAHHPAQNPSCKAIPGSPDWPSGSSWSALNSSLSGRLLQLAPPGAVCHPDQPTYNAAICLTVQDGSQRHGIQRILGKGYPVYVVNATCPEDVKKGVDFAREHNVRLIVKGTGHDYLGSFRPKGCDFSIDTHALTAAAGSQFNDIDLQASLRNLTVVAGGSETVGIGGYLTGGGHSALGPTYGMAVDQVLEMEIVTPGGDILTTNECQNQDLFWAMRGGGGSTFGIITSATIKAFPSALFAVTSFIISTPTTSDAFWGMIAYILSQYPNLSAQGIAGYPFILPNFTNPALNTTNVAAFAGELFIPLLSLSNTSASLAAAVGHVFANATAPYPSQFQPLVIPITYPDFYTWFKDHNGPLDGGYDGIVGSWLLDAKALMDSDALKQAIKQFTPPDSSSALYLVSGKGVWNAVLRGGSSSINLAWRKALVHFTNSVGWSPFDNTKKRAQENLLTNV